MDYKELIRKYEAGYEKLKTQLEDVPPGAIDFKPASGSWTIREIILHMADSEANAYIRGRKAIAESGSEISIYDQDAWVSELLYSEMSYEDALELFRLLRRNMTSLLEKLPDNAWHRYVTHPKTGKIKLVDWINLYTGHVANHIQQIHRNLYEYLKSTEG